MREDSKLRRYNELKEKNTVSGDTVLGEEKENGLEDEFYDFSPY